MKRCIVSLHSPYHGLPLYLLCCFCLVLLLCPNSGWTADKKAQELQAQQARVRANQERISRMTQEERKMDSSLATMEDQLKALEQRLDVVRNKVASLSKTDENLRKQLMLLQRQKNITAASLAQAQQLLWQMETKKQIVGHRNPLEWPAVDREVTWVATLHAIVHEHYTAQAEQEIAINKTLGERETVKAAILAEQEAVQNEKIALLKTSTTYRRRIGELRQEKSSTEAEVQETLRLVKKLNLALSKPNLKAPFPSLKGALPWPVEGTIITRFGLNTFSGLALSTTGAQKVRAVAYGKVVHNDILRGFGRVVVLLHGEDYYSLYAYLSESSLRVGEEVASQDTVGIVGFYPEIKDNGLYFELRFHQKVINPEEWFTKKS